jgi:predicted dehydrogenase
MNDRMVRWGILSTAEIARKNWHAIAASGNGRVTAVASRLVDKAAAFIRECQSRVPVTPEVAAVSGYDALLARADIDAVYLPLPTGLRTEWVIKAARAGKHVLVEKPVGVHTDDVRAMIAACDAAGVQFMDGVMFMHSARMPALREVLDDGQSVGTIRRIASQFSFCAPDSWVQSNIRASSQLEPAGCLGDLGWYTIRITLWVMNGELPVEVRGRILQGVRRPGSDREVPMEFQGEMHFADGVSATFFNSFRTHHQQWFHVSGTGGYVHVPDFVLPYYGSASSFEVAQHQFVADGCQFNMEPHFRRVSAPEYSNNHRTSQEATMFRTFNELVLSGRRDRYWPDIALRTQQVLDAAFRSAHNGGSAETP